MSDLPQDKPLGTSGRDRVSELLAAGFTPPEIGAWATARRGELAAAGFAPAEIDDYIGNQPKLSGPFFDRMVKGGTLRPDTMPTMQEELNRGLGRSALSVLATVPQMYAQTITRIGETLGIPGIEEAGKLGTAALAADKEAADKALAPGVPSVSDVQSPSDAAHYLVGKIGEVVPVIGEYLALGVPRMVVLGAYSGAVRAFQQTKGDQAATATGAVIGATLAGAQIPFLNGAVGKGLVDTVVKSVLGNAAVSVAGAFAERLPKAVAGQGYEVPTAGEVAEAGATGAIGGAVFGAHGTLAKAYQLPAGQRQEMPIGGLPDADNIAAATKIVLPGVVAPQAHNAIERAYEVLGVHPAEIAADANRDVTISQDLAGGKVPEAYRPTAQPDTQEASLTPLLRDESGALRPGGKGAGGVEEPPTEPPRTQEEARARILSRLSIGETDGGRPWSWSRLYTAVVDRLHPLAALPRGDLPTSEDPYQLARLYAGVSGKADHFLNYGTFDFPTYQSTGKGLREILAPVRDDLDGFRSFATSLRALELEQRGVKTGVDLDAARMEARAGADKYAPVMAELVQYQNRLAAYLRDSGVLSREGHDAMVQANPIYMPFQRVFGDVAGDIIPEVVRGPGRSLEAANPIHEIVGSERRIIDPLESVVRNTYLALAMAERNAVGTKLVDLVQRAGGMPEGTAEVTIYRNGQRETHRVNEDLAIAMRGLDEESANTMLRLLGAPARMLRAGATLTPDFIARNALRDFVSAVVNTTKGVFSPLDSVRGLMGVIRRDADFREWLKGGGAQATMVALDRRYLQQDLGQLTADTGLMTRGWNVVRHPIDTLRAISEVVEQATRLGEFKGVRQQELAAGATEKEAAQAAAYASREVTLDFARRGSQTQAMNMITAFWNAQVQGVDRFARAVKDDPAGTMFKVAVGITLPSILLWFNNHDDPRYEELPQWQKDLFWIVMTPSTIYRIPKPFEVGVIFGTGPERLLDAFYAQRPEAFRGYAKSVVGALMPSVVPTAALPVIEQWANRSSFTDRTLVPANVEKLLPEYQYTPYTTETAKRVGEVLSAFPGLSEARTEPGAAAGVARALTTPILMENYVRAWTGGLGVYVLQATDASLRKAGVLPDPPKPEDTLADIPVVKAFVVRYPTASAESIQRFYDDYDERKRYFASFMAKAKEGDLEAAQRVMEMGGPNMFVQLDRLHKTLGQQAQVARNIYKDPAMSPGDKRQQLDSVYFGMIQVARAGNAALARPSPSGWRWGTRPEAQGRPLQ